MFFQVSNPQSSNIAELMVNPATSECIVEYKSGGTYSYTNVDRVAIDDLLYDELTSVLVSGLTLTSPNLPQLLLITWML